MRRGARSAGDRLALSADRFRPAVEMADPAGIRANVGRHRGRIDPALSDDAAAGQSAHARIKRAKPVDPRWPFGVWRDSAAAAVLAWIFEWARSYVLAAVSENLAADLRLKTYAHLQWLSLEFFGGKRTGDLMSRVGNDTDRINTFLSVNLVAFGSDMLMMVMTAVVLLSINPLLAVVSLAPFPFIVWMIYWVRERLRRGFRQAGVAQGELNSVLADTIPGIRVVKAFAQEEREIERFGRTQSPLWWKSTTG